MRNEFASLSDIEIRALVLCEKWNAELSFVKRVLSVQQSRPFADREIESIYSKLARLGLVRRYRRVGARLVRVSCKDRCISEVVVRSTRRASTYFDSGSHTTVSSGC